MATCDAVALQQQACESKFSCLDPLTQQALILQLLCNISESGPPGSVAWGDITGLLSNQADLQAALNAKVDDGAVTTSGLTMATARILGRSTGGIGAIEELASVPVSLGGTGATSLPDERLLIGNSTGAVNTFAELNYDDEIQQLNTPTIVVSAAPTTIWLDSNGIEIDTGGNAIQLNAGGTSVFQGDLTVEGNLQVNTDGLIQGDLQVDGKITATGGVDPPYVLFDANTRDALKARVLKEVPEAKRSGAAQFWNPDTSRMEIYRPDSDKFYDLLGNPL